MTNNSDIAGDELVRLCAKLREHFKPTRYEYEVGAQALCINPDGPEAATALEQLSAELKAVKLERDQIRMQFEAAMGKGRLVPTTRAGP